MRVYKEDETKDDEKPTKSVCEKKERHRRKGKKNKVFWIPKEQEVKPIRMFSECVFRHVTA